MDYYAIGQRIRKIRKANRLSQEQLAERVGISVTHMSHIETGNTKLSLEVFAEIAQALDARTD
ncbi:MAG: helix-turn-helix domain-containing protein, partial [Oscillospiraceae bacterium]